LRREITKQDGNPFVVADMLVLGDAYSSRFLEQSFVTPFGIQLVQGVGQPIVFAHPKSVQGGEHWLLVYATVTWYANTILKTILNFKLAFFYEILYLIVQRII